MARRGNKNEWDTLATVLTWSFVAIVAIVIGIFKTIGSFISWLNKNHQSNQIKKQNKMNTSDVISGVVLGTALSKKNNKENSAFEKEMDWHGLNEEEKQEVRKGNYEVFNFEEENTEEDDYYHEDV